MSLQYPLLFGHPLYTVGGKCLNRPSYTMAWKRRHPNPISVTAIVSPILPVRNLANSIGLRMTGSPKTIVADAIVVVANTKKKKLKLTPVSGRAMNYWMP
jgi:hypothetical protein